MTRTSVLEKDEQRQSKDLRIAHVQMMENIYRFGMVIDVENIGLVREPVIEGTGSRQQVTGWKTVVDIGQAERNLRLKALLNGVFNLSGFAKQARAAASLSPDFILLALQGTYNQRGLKALELDEEGRVKLICSRPPCRNTGLWETKSSAGIPPALQSMKGSSWSFSARKVSPPCLCTRYLPGCGRRLVIEGGDTVLKVLYAQLEIPFWCSFRVPYGVNMHFTYPVPPLTTLAGLVAAALGYPADFLEPLAGLVFGVGLEREGRLIETYTRIIKRDYRDQSCAPSSAGRNSSNLSSAFI